jgi:hypothetical protein
VAGAIEILKKKEVTCVWLVSVSSRNLLNHVKWKRRNIQCLPQTMTYTVVVSSATTLPAIYIALSWFLVYNNIQHSFILPLRERKRKGRKKKSCCYKDMLRATLVKRTLPKDCWIVLVCLEFLTSNRKKKVSYILPFFRRSSEKMMFFLFTPKSFLIK